MRRAGLAAVAGLALLLTACSGSGHGTHPAAPATSAAGGTLTNVTVRTAGDAVSGQTPPPGDRTDGFRGDAPRR